MILGQRPVTHGTAGMESSHVLHFPSVGVIPALCPAVFQKMPTFYMYERDTSDNRMGTGHMTLERLCDPACTNGLALLT